MKRLIGLLILLGGCSIQQYPPINVATTNDILAEYATLSYFTASPLDYALLGYTINDRRCSAYFNQLTMDANRANQQVRSVNLLGSTAGAAMGLAGVAGPSIAGVALATGTLGQLIGNQHADLDGITPVPLSGLVMKARRGFEDAAGAPQSITQAAQFVEADGEFCQPAGAQLLNAQAIMNSTVVAQTQVNSVQGFNSISAPIRLVPPIMVAR